MYDATIKVDGRHRRRNHTAEFKRRVVQECLQPHVSMAAVSRTHNLNANLVRRWVADFQKGKSSASYSSVSGTDQGALDTTLTDGSSPQSEFIALSSTNMFIPTRASSTHPVPEAATVAVDLTRGTWQVRLHWPGRQLEALAPWLRRLTT